MKRKGIVVELKGGDRAGGRGSYGMAVKRRGIVAEGKGGEGGEGEAMEW